MGGIRFWQEYILEGTLTVFGTVSKLFNLKQGVYNYILIFIIILMIPVDSLLLGAIVFWSVIWQCSYKLISLHYLFLV